ncbi:MAG TPA: diacylglycerol kinase family protein [Methylophilaceae bacterium]|nr:diacylglycerol kinase family protein [Methylophilaceae bacterium]
MAHLSVADNAPLFIILNAGSGHNDMAETCAAIESVLTEAAREHELILVDDPAKLAAVAKSTVEKAQARQGVVVMGGGDGSINTVAQAVLGSGCPFGILPQGTFNLFARAHGIPLDTAEATRILLGSTAEAVDVGLVNDQVFLVNASMGMYPQVLQDRETWKAKYGRNRVVAFLAGILTLMQQHRQVHVTTLEKDGKPGHIRTPTLFVCINDYQLRETGILADEESLAPGQMMAVTVRPLSALGLLWLMVCGTFGKLGEAENIVSFQFENLSITRAGNFRTRTVRVAADGELFWLSLPLEFRIAPQPLYLLKPDAAQEAIPEQSLSKAA